MKTLVGLFILLFSIPAASQVDEATKLLGELTPIRENFDVQSYHLDIEVDPEQKMISGHNTIAFKAVEDIEEVQIDLFENMNVSKISQGNTDLDFERKFNSILIDLAREVEKEQVDSITVFYDGSPQAATNPPWDGGFIWTTDSLGNPWVAVAIEGLGASSWWPNKDHLSDEPDEGIRVDITVPADLMAISNGSLIGEEELGELKKYKWRTSYPIDNYNVTLYVGDYVNFKEYYEGIPERNEQGAFTSQEGRALDIDYYVLSENLEKAKTYFDFTEDVLQTMEIAFGPYPFYDDGFAVVESPYLGMEHQSAIAYGNGYQSGWKGDLIKPYLEWDYLFVHEVAHEWWGNNVSMDDRASMWIQESFATYADAFYAYSMFGYEGYLDMMDHFRTLVKNERPILGEYGIMDEGTIDQYYKGALMLGTLSQLVESNQDWLGALQKAQEAFRAPKTVSTVEFLEFLEKELKYELDEFFEQYLETTMVPKLIARAVKDDGKDYVIYKWTNIVEGFDMPVKLKVKQYDEQWIYPTSEWKKIELPRGYENEHLGFNTRHQYYDLDFQNEL